MTNIPFTNLRQQYLDCAAGIDSAIQRWLTTSAYITNTNATAFELAFADYCASEDCAAVSSGSTALICALRAAGLGAGDEIITTPMTFVSTTEAIVAVGAVPVFVDIDPHTYLMDLSQVRAAVTDRTRAVLFVDLYGQCPDIETLRAICQQHGLLMIEDAAQSVGNCWHDRPVGSLSDITCVSFNPVKNLGAMGDAGAVLGSADTVQKVRSLRDHGRSSKHDVGTLGFNARSDLLQQQILLAKLPHLDAWIQRKREICDRYTQDLSDVVITPEIQPGNSHSWYVYVIRTPDRDALAQRLQQQGIGTNCHYPRVTSQQGPFRTWYRSCPYAEQAVGEILSLPCWYSMTDSQVSAVIQAVRSSL